MGASPNRIVGHHLTSTGRWLQVGIGCGDTGEHAGFTVGRTWGADVSDPGRAAESVATLRRGLDLAVAALDDREAGSTASLDALIATWTAPAPAASPWPGVVPAAWWAGRTQAEREALRDQIVLAFLDARVSA